MNTFNDYYDSSISLRLHTTKIYSCQVTMLSDDDMVLCHLTLMDIKNLRNQLQGDGYSRRNYECFKDIKTLLWVELTDNIYEISISNFDKYNLSTTVKLSLQARDIIRFDTTLKQIEKELKEKGGD